MLQTAIAADAETQNEWADRSELWAELANSTIPKRRVRQRRLTPLILCGHGISMRIENGALVIRDGFTHYPQCQAKYRFFPRDLNLPPRIVMLDGSGTLSFDVLSWLAEQGIALARVKWTGEIAIVASGIGYAADREKVQWQHDTRTDQMQRLIFAADLIRRKLVATVETLRSCFQPDVTVGKAIADAECGISRLSAEQFDAMSGIFAIEGECAKTYFAAWHRLQIDWTGTGRRAVPDEWRNFTARSSLLSGVKPKNRLASHPVNAMLNYAYAVRQSQLQIDAVADGYDPTIGIMHNRHQGSCAYILDLIEPERPKVDAKILQFVASRTFAASDFPIRADGVCRLSPQLARAVASLITL